MPRRSALPEPLEGRAFSTREAARHGVPRSRTRAVDLQAPFHGIRMPAGPIDTIGLALAYSRWMKSTEYFSHTTAAELHGMRMPEGYRSSSIHVTAIAPARAPRSKGIIGHRARGVEVVTLASGLRAATPVATWLQLGALLDLDSLIIMGDGLVRRWTPAASLAQLEDAVATNAGHRGHRRIATAMRMIRARTDSARETMLRLMLVRAQLPEPEINFPVVNSLGAVIAHGDLAYPKFRVILEYDGGQHRENDRQFSVDIARLDSIMEEKWRVIRVDKQLMLQRATLVGKVETALRAAGWDGSRPGRR